MESGWSGVILVCMRTTLNLDDELLEAAMEYANEREKTAVIHMALREFVAAEAGRRLAAMGGSMPDIEDVPRRRPPVTRAS